MKFAPCGVSEKASSSVKCGFHQGPGAALQQLNRNAGDRRPGASTLASNTAANNKKATDEQNTRKPWYHLWW
jgi:hypothetical protein